ncbi:FecCD family ABC transporter permease [Kibdelosporangium phytohabitans]|uniref:Iron ABC transporter n=1 Tax=Kibdelosporangium phytohabitans TaxID=860235 RepID=A0A0N9I530_9PSEU|nr:iron ABC transporter permease [Kibdelosporangium phytohabitans]ALG10997.1 iron ABC transporter [Kibdelosporangium phytohabitans]MBE1462211.1 iron complex transport system permease protein [Kibdelosporangium phytohabitans]
MTRLVVRPAPAVSFTLHKRGVVTGIGLLVALALAAVASLSIGSTFVEPGDVLRALFDIPTWADRLVESRIPRIVLAMVVGAALGLAGALLQGVSRNPLASPDVIGVSQGAGLAASIVIVSGAPIAVLPPLALLGGLGAAAIVLLFGSVRGNRFVLAGIAVAVALRALTEIVIVGAAPIDGQRAQIWIVGTLAGWGYDEALVIAVVIAVLTPVLLWAGRALDTSALSDDVAMAIGVRVGPRRLVMALSGVVLAAFAISQVGAVDFVALAAPQIARRLAKAERPPLFCAAVTGALLTVAADTAARTLFAPNQLPVGVMTAAFGGLYLIWLLVRRKR